MLIFVKRLPYSRTMDRTCTPLRVAVQHLTDIPYFTGEVDQADPNSNVGDSI